MTVRRTSKRLAGALAAILLLASTPALAKICKDKPESLPAGAPAPPAGEAFHYDAPRVVASTTDGRVLVTRTWGGADIDRVIVWDGHALTPKRVFYTSVPNEDRLKDQPIPAHSVAIPGADLRSVTISADGQYLAFAGGDGDGYCTDVYHDGTHVARFQQRHVAGFIGDDLVLYQSIFKGLTNNQRMKTEGMFIQPLKSKLVKKDITPKTLIPYAKGNLSLYSTGIRVYPDGTLVLHDERPPGMRVFFDPANDYTAVSDAHVPNVIKASVVEEEGGYRIRVDFNGVPRKLDVLFDPAQVQRQHILVNNISEDYLQVSWLMGEGVQRKRYVQVFDPDLGTALHAVPFSVPVPSGPDLQNRVIASVLADGRVLMAVRGLFEPELIDPYTGDSTVARLTQPLAEAKAVAARNEARRQREREIAEMRAAAAAAVQEHPLVRKLHASGTTDPYEVEVYCRLGGPRCQEFRAKARQAQTQRNINAERENLRRIQSLYADDTDIFMESRRRKECLRRRYDPTAIADPKFSGQSVGTCER
ncbi:MAG: hypothetical protein V2I38_12990 [Alcanivoracaceae bacterium]|jgi:hypothetical protein|nr:hypothetical protein [Alcanivoracaceae bacterium]